MKTRVNMGRDEIGKKIKMMRIEKKLTQKQLGKALNFSESAVSLWERGERGIDTDTLQQVSDFFDVPLTYFLGSKTDVVSSSTKPVYQKNITLYDQYDDKLLPGRIGILVLSLLTLLLPFFRLAASLQIVSYLLLLWILISLYSIFHFIKNKRKHTYVYDIAANYEVLYESTNDSQKSKRFFIANIFRLLLLLVSGIFIFLLGDIYVLNNFTQENMEIPFALFFFSYIVIVGNALFVHIKKGIPKKRISYNEMPRYRGIRSIMILPIIFGTAFIIFNALVMIYPENVLKNQLYWILTGFLPCLYLYSYILYREYLRFYSDYYLGYVDKETNDFNKIH